MNIFKKIALINKIKKTIKQAKKSIDTNKGLADEVKRIVANLKSDIEALLSYLPMFKPVVSEFYDLIKGFWK